MKQINKSNTQIVAHCFFSHGEIKYENYDKFYRQQEEQHILDIIEANADY